MRERERTTRWMTTQESGRNKIDRDAHFLLPPFPIDELVASKTATALFGIAQSAHASKCLIFGRVTRVFAALKLGIFHFGHTEYFLHFGIISLQIRRNARRNEYASNSPQRFRAMPYQQLGSSASCPVPATEYSHRLTLGDGFPKRRVRQRA